MIARLAEVLRGEGIAVATIRYRLAPEHGHPAAAEDVAAALAFLAEHAEVTDTRYHDDSRVTLECRIPRAFLSKVHENGTTVTLHVPMKREALDEFVRGSERALTTWCRHTEIPLRVVAGLDEEDEAPAPSAPAPSVRSATPAPLGSAGTRCW